MIISSRTRRVTAIAATAATALTLGLGAFVAAPAQAQTVTITINVGNCATVDVTEGRDSNGAFVSAYVRSDSCGIGIEGAIEGTYGTPYSYGGDVHLAGEFSETGYIPINSGNHHGLRAWVSNTWQYYWAD